jgi:hypothetical protein
MNHLAAGPPLGLRRELQAQSVSSIGGLVAM